MSGFLMIIMLVLSASLMYLIEHGAQPKAFADIPSAMWWSLVTLTTVGYGDVTPVTILGKVLGGFVTILGLGMYALPAAILASGFIQELSKRQFVVTWGMVAKVPFFGSLDAEKIAEIAALLKPWAVPERYTIIRRGEAADSMYFIVSGDVEVDLPPNSFHLTTGEYFGEMGIVQPQRAGGQCDLYNRVPTADPASARSEPATGGQSDARRRADRIDRAPLGRTRQF